MLGVSKITIDGINALSNASTSGTSIKPKYFVVSNQDLEVSENLTANDINGWFTKDIDGYNKINSDQVEFACKIEPDNATDFARFFGIFLEDGTLFMVGKPAYPYPPGAEHIFLMQMVYNNVDAVVNFEYLPFDEQEQYSAILDTQVTYFLQTLPLVERQEQIHYLLQRVLHGSENKTFKAKEAQKDSEVVNLGQIKKLHKTQSNTLNLPNGNIKTQIFTGYMVGTDNYFGYVEIKEVSGLLFVDLKITINLANTVSLPNDDEWYVNIPKSVIGLNKATFLQANGFFQFWRDGADTPSQVCQVTDSQDYIKIQKEETLGGANSTDLNKLIITINLILNKGV